MRNTIGILLIASPLLLTTAQAAAQHLSITQYLEQVQTTNKSVQSSIDLSKGSEAFKGEAALLLSPTLFIDTFYLDDKKPPFSTLLQGDRSVNQSYTFGVSKLTDFGLEGSLSYKIFHTNIYDYPNLSIPGFPAIAPSTDYYEARPELKITQSLWKNAFGALTKANQMLNEAQNDATMHLENYKIRQALAQAESAYWRLTLARELIDVERQSVERAEKIKEWALRREHLQLGDKSDRLQADAALELRNLDLRGAEDEQRSACRAFNSSRQIDSDDVSETLLPLDSKRLLIALPPARAAFREDVLAARAVEQANQAKAEVSLQTLSPDLQVYGTFDFNGKDDQLGAVIPDSFKSDHPTWLVGIKLTAPLDLPLIFKSRGGHHLESQAASLAYDRKVFEQENEWKDLARKLEEAKRRLKLTLAIETIQKEKLVNEKTRLTKGRTTTYQVLTFEQDYAIASITRIHTESEVVNIIAQMKIFMNTTETEKL